MSNLRNHILALPYFSFCIARGLFINCFFNFLSYDKKRTNKKLFLDISNVYTHDLGTGVSRVVNKLRVYIKQKVVGYEICEVYLAPYSGYYSCETKKKIKFHEGDILFCLDAVFVQVGFNKMYFKKLYKKGVSIWFIIYDLIPILNKETAEKCVIKYFEKWLIQALQYTGIIAISESTLNDVKNYIKVHPNLKYNKDLHLEYALLGSDFQKRDDTAIIIKKTETPSFLMVSTVEPRKKYDQAVRAFSILWDKGYDCTLHIVGRPGWKNEETINLIQNHNQLNKHLFWYNTGISDEELSSLYQNCTAVVFASIAEGFGLAIMEAASYKKPLILRDLPVFKEIAADNAFYFSGLSPENLADKLIEWLELYKNNKYPVSNNIRFISWDDCTEKILSIISK